jgi:hypothetical protein
MKWLWWMKMRSRKIYRVIFLFTVRFISFAGFASFKFSFEQLHRSEGIGLEILLVTLNSPLAEARKWRHTALSTKCLSWRSIREVGRNSVVSAQTSYRQHSGVRYGPRNQTMLRLVGKCERTGSVADERKRHAGRPSIRTPEMVGNAPKILLRSSKVWENFHNRWGCLQYGKENLSKWLVCMSLKFISANLLKPNAKIHRVQFAMNCSALLERKPDIKCKIWFSDEAHFHSDGYVGKQNARSWTLEDPRAVVDKP